MELITFWKKLRKGSSLIHPSDGSEAPTLFEETYPALQKVNKVHFVRQLTSWGTPEPTAIHHVLVPQPYCGSIEPKKGQVYFLMLNPGFNPFDYCELDNRLFRVAVWKNLRQRKMKYPFFFFNPKFWWHPGYQYWNKRFGWLIEAVGREELAQHFTSIELFAYHSKTYPSKLHRTIKNLPSTQALLKFLKDELVPKAIKGEVLLVVVRGRKDFGELFPTNCKNIIFSASARSSYISEDSKIGKRIRDFLK